MDIKTSTIYVKDRLGIYGKKRINVIREKKVLCLKLKFRISVEK